MIELYTILITKILFLDNSLDDLSNKIKIIFNDLIANNDSDEDDESSSSSNSSDYEEIDDDLSENEFTLESQNSLEGKKEVIVIPIKNSSDSKNQSTSTLKKRKRKGMLRVNDENDDEKEKSFVIDTSTSKSILYNPISHLDTIGNAAFAEADKEKELSEISQNEDQDENKELVNKSINDENNNEYEENYTNKNNIGIIVDPGSTENSNIDINESSKPYSIFSSPIKLSSMDENNSEPLDNNSITNEEKPEFSLDNINIDKLFTVNFKKQIIPFECSLFVNSHPLIISYFINIILKNITNTFNKIKALKYSKEELVLSPLHELINNLKLRAVELISKNTIEETKTFFKYENWIMDDDIYNNLRLKNTENENNIIHSSALSNKSPSITSSNQSNEKSSTTLYLKLFYNFLKFIIRTLNVISKLHTAQEASVLTATENTSKSNKKTNSIYTLRSSKSNYDMSKLEENINLYEKLIKLIENCVIKSNFALLDSFNFLSEASETEINQILEKEELKNPLIGAKNIKLNVATSGISNIGVLNDSISSELNNVNINSATTMVDLHKKSKKKFDIKNNVSNKINK